MSIPAGAALGSTSDPRALIVGEPAGLDAAADLLDREAVTMSAVAADLRAVRTPSWDGVASTGFWVKFGGEPRAWEDVAHVMTRSASAVRDQAGALRSAQDRAQQAIDLWEEARQASQAARASHDARVDSHARQVQAGQVALPPGPFRDPGDDLRTEAQEILDDAARSLDQAGLDNAGTIAGLAGLHWNQTSVSADSFTADGSASGPRGSYGSSTLFHERRAPWQSYKKTDPSSQDPRVSLGLGSVSGFVGGRADASTGGNYHGLDHEASGNVRVGLEGSAGASLDRDGLALNANASAGVTAEGKVSGEYGIASAGASGQALVGGRVDLEARVGADGVHASGEAFVGARVEGSLEGDVGGVGGAVRGEAWAGAGIAGDVDFGFEDGEFTIGGDVGVGLGVGGKVGGSITINPGEVADTIGDMADGIGDFLGL